MGVDLLDINFHIEKSFGIKMTIADWHSISELDADGTPRDIVVKQVYWFIIDRLEEQQTTFGSVVQPGRPANTKSAVQWDGENVWHELCNIIAECLVVDLEEVTADARMIADLGME